ncbi:hypothetical protein [Nonomuraea recticatena]|uniref:hypothetical protein n=1 Tax=Nonomuraea recticatena TaxID=46178 RepID=UPI003608F54C
MRERQPVRRGQADAATSRLEGVGPPDDAFGDAVHVERLAGLVARHIHPQSGPVTYQLPTSVTKGR